MGDWERDYGMNLKVEQRSSVNPYNHNLQTDEDRLSEIRLDSPTTLDQALFKVTASGRLTGTRYHGTDTSKFHFNYKANHLIEDALISREYQALEPYQVALRLRQEDF
jgi:hypothetical protein